VSDLNEASHADTLPSPREAGVQSLPLAWNTGDAASPGFPLSRE